MWQLRPPIHHWTIHFDSFIDVYMWNKVHFYILLASGSDKIECRWMANVRSEYSIIIQWTAILIWLSGHTSWNEFCFWFGRYSKPRRIFPCHFFARTGHTIHLKTHIEIEYSFQMKLAKSIAALTHPRSLLRSAQHFIALIVSTRCSPI